ncbi:hypothetical protein [Methylobacterium sp. yr596]|uniref:hypothetical protein n=1 Tax=Methylobacterium sp. yr596 TaxID=1761800 RepID=UPI000B8266E9|nr:hypothetical protein [Methylobacterium sp. yr596]
MTGPDHHAEMEAHFAASMERQDEAHCREVMKWLSDLMSRLEEPLVGSFGNSLSHAGLGRLSALMSASARQAEADLAYHLLCQEERQLRASLTEVREWISNWSPNFTQDEEWPETKARMDAALSF